MDIDNAFVNRYSKCVFKNEMRKASLLVTSERWLLKRFKNDLLFYSIKQDCNEKA